mmetsp:Transcript_34431/g.118687  ORF Transcript_34431/g.118687 Transcript_34431/m.118687 type:complete len:379 (-) Transcript_34431:734-1870(-)
MVRRRLPRLWGRRGVFRRRVADFDFCPVTGRRSRRRVVDLCSLRVRRRGEVAAARQLRGRAVGRRARRWWARVRRRRFVGRRGLRRVLFRKVRRRRRRFRRRARVPGCCAGRGFRRFREGDDFSRRSMCENRRQTRRRRHPRPRAFNRRPPAADAEGLPGCLGGFAASCLTTAQDGHGPPRLRRRAKAARAAAPDAGLFRKAARVRAVRSEPRHVQGRLAAPSVRGSGRSPARPHRFREGVCGQGAVRRRATPPPHDPKTEPRARQHAAAHEALRRLGRRSTPRHGRFRKDRNAAGGRGGRARRQGPRRRPRPGAQRRRRGARGRRGGHDAADPRRHAPRGHHRGHFRGRGGRGRRAARDGLASHRASPAGLRPCSRL